MINISKFKLTFTALATSSFLALSPVQAEDATESTDKVLAVINGHDITENQVSTFFRIQGPQSGLNLKDPQAQSQLFKLFVDRELLYQEAVAQKIDQEPDVLSVIEEQRRQEIAKSIIERYTQKNPITKERVKEYYDKEYGSDLTHEYKLRHIQLGSEEEAKSVITKLDDGEEFTKLTKELSQDTSASSGGDLGWHSLAGLPKEFTDKIRGLDAGQYTKTPVQSDSGWHVVKIDEKRPQLPPPFESVQNEIFSLLQNRLISDYLADLKSKANIEIKQ